MPKNTRLNTAVLDVIEKTWAFNVAYAETLPGPEPDDTDEYRAWLVDMVDRMSLVVDAIEDARSDMRRS